VSAHGGITAEDAYEDYQNAYNQPHLPTHFPADYPLLPIISEPAPSLACILAVRVLTAGLTKTFCANICRFAWDGVARRGQAGLNRVPAD